MAHLRCKDAKKISAKALSGNPLIAMERFALMHQIMVKSFYFIKICSSLLLLQES